MTTTKKVLMLGAGLVTRPAVRYLLEQAGVQVILASLELEQCQAMIAGHPQGEALFLDVAKEPERLQSLVEDCDVVVSLLPWTLHLQVAKLCLRLKTHMVTASYVSPEMRALDAEAREAGVLLLNEIGVDPGIDHMSAMQIIDAVKAKGGVVRSFRSYCGGLPAPHSDDNPWGYKFSWSPRGVVLAARNTAKYIEDGHEKLISNWDIFSTLRYVRVGEIGILEAYPNRDSTQYVDLYGLHDAHTVYRGTLRYPGYSTTFKAIVRSGFLDLDERVGMKDRTYAEFVSNLASCTVAKVRKAFARKVGLAVSHDALNRMEWLGLFGDDKIGVDQISPLDVLCKRLSEKLDYRQGEQDMIVMRHEFEAEYAGAASDSPRREIISSELVNYGEIEGDSSMARTVSLPVAIATRLICEDKIDLRGVQIPTDSSIYRPVLDELRTLGMSFDEKTRVL